MRDIRQVFSNSSQGDLTNRPYKAERSAVRLPLTASVVLAFAAVVLRVVVMQTDIEPASGLYVPGSPFAVVLPLVFGVVIGVLVLLCLPLRRQTLVLKPQTGMPSAFVLLIAGVVFLYQLFAQAIADQTVHPALWVLSLVLAAVSAVYFLGRGAGKLQSGDTVTVVLAVAPVSYFALHLILFFIDTSLPMTAAEHRLSTLTQCLLCLFLVADMRTLLPEKSGKADARYVFFSLSCFVFAGVLGLPSLFLGSFWLYKSLSPASTYVLYLTLGLYALTRAVSIGKDRQTL